jgi:hypothetical protein
LEFRPDMESDKSKTTSINIIGIYSDYQNCLNVSKKITNMGLFPHKMYYMQRPINKSC